MIMRNDLNAVECVNGLSEVQVAGLRRIEQECNAANDSCFSAVDWQAWLNDAKPGCLPVLKIICPRDRTEQPVAFVAFVEMPEVVQIQRVAVRPEFQRKGYGSWLIDQILVANREKSVTVRHRFGCRQATRLFDDFDFVTIGQSGVDGWWYRHRVRNPRAVEVG